MASTDKLTIGIVACGGISHAHGQAAQANSSKVNIIACCDVVADRAAAWADQYGCERHYTDYEEMMAKEDLDAVLLATWPNQHREQIEKVLAAGVKNILCEKELTLTGQEAAEIYELVNSAGAFLMEAFMYRHHPAIGKLRELVDAGEIGEIDSVRACFSSFDPEEGSADDETRNWRQRKECGGGIPYDFACYSVNAVQYFADGVPTRVQCYGGVSEKFDIVNRMYGLIQFDNGRVGIIESSKKEAFTQELQINGSKGILDLPISWTIGDSQTITLLKERGWAQLAKETFTLPAPDSYALQMSNFVDVIRDGAAPVLSLVESVVNAFTIETLVNSLLEGREIELDIPKEIRNALA